MDKKLELLVSSKDFFQKAVEDGFSARKIKTYPAVHSYLVNILENYVHTQNLFEPNTDSGERKFETLAEMYLRASQAESNERVEMYKRLGDRALYISGFFGDSLTRKVVDIDYYANIGGAAYGQLAHCIKEDTAATVYRVFSKRFLDFVEVLTYISQKTFMQSDQNILRLYDRYLRTGSDTAKEKLIELGVLTVPQDQLKLGRQD